MQREQQISPALLAQIEEQKANNRLKQKRIRDQIIETNLSKLREHGSKQLEEDAGKGRSKQKSIRQLNREMKQVIDYCNEEEQTHKKPANDRKSRYRKQAAAASKNFRDHEAATQVHDSEAVQTDLSDSEEPHVSSSKRVKKDRLAGSTLDAGLQDELRNQVLGIKS